MIISNVRLPTREGLHDVTICGDRISELRRHQEDRAESSQVVLVGEGNWLIPGWIDLQVNDMEWFDSAMNGERKDISDHAQRIVKVLECQLKQGVTHMLLVGYRAA
jgi:N-acetylglucosamine-6-phosphate deacetylase